MNQYFKTKNPATMNHNNKLIFAKIGILSIILYASLHLLEEGLAGFPAWAERAWGIPGYTNERWLIHNFFFLGVQLIAFMIYIFKDMQNQLWILGIVMWGILNTLNHTIFSVILQEYSPGLFTGFLFIFPLIWIIKVMIQKQILKRFTVIKGIGIGILLWIIPMLLFLSFDIFILKIV